MAARNSQIPPRARETGCTSRRSRDLARGASMSHSRRAQRPIIDVKAVQTEKKVQSIADTYGPLGLKSLDEPGCTMKIVYCTCVLQFHFLRLRETQESEIHSAAGGPDS
ncbi:hypothetical protein JDV02_006015 [Purpureocillium takamizusanense]|uniref:Uncharacterized protein n=1 Tax=Purpureocillium takamizusanense TaxID=2060973 RepID=A0A9Q8QHQ5_9HYPO|nr:uncharacterized protein JDV02_006015 [Purpureocillium takamizusanense]UNI19870.1 hypothetical protein JDV02_006015 [Purpureocillium takamizusanense]